MDYTRRWAVRVGPAQDLGKFLLLAALAALSFGARPVAAGELHLLVNGKAIHLEQQPGVRYNEENWGAGLQYDFDRRGDWVPFLTAAEFQDSNGNPSYYAGGGALRRYTLAPDLDNLRFDLGVVAFLMQREGFMDDKPFPGVLPVASLGTDHVSINITYIPKVDPKMVPILFFQLKIRLAQF
jgi:hypothetical protein